MFLNLKLKIWVDLRLGASHIIKRSRWSDRLSFFDHIGPFTFAGQRDGRAVHPHQVATVTLAEGALHRDSLKMSFKRRFNWMTADGGICPFRTSPNAARSHETKLQHPKPGLPFPDPARGNRSLVPCYPAVPSGESGVITLIAGQAYGRITCSNISRR